jgi:aspartyl aminopeptidase
MIASKLVRICRPILRISNLAIHLQTAKEREAFAVNKEDHLSPILATEAQHALMKPSPVSNSTTTTTTTTTKEDGWHEHQEPALLQILAKELDCSIDDLVDFELSLFDVQKASLGGAFEEFLYSARLDNLASCFIAVQGLLDFCNSEECKDSSSVSMICLYDHEEVGSSSAVGAASPILSEAVPRILASLNGGTPVTPDVVAATLAQSLVLSSDQAHAVHPNYASKHEKAHQPHMNNGMVIKRNTNQRYATTPWTGIVMREIARQAGLPALQEFIVRQDCGCGSTIGPLISTQTGIAAIDMGCPQLSMHSIREIMGVADLQFGVRLFDAFFRYYPSVRKNVEN